MQEKQHLCAEVPSTPASDGGGAALRREISRLQEELTDKNRHIRNLEDFAIKARRLPGYRLYRWARSVQQRFPGPPARVIRTPGPRTWEADQTRVRSPSLPWNLFLEVTNRCNLSCIMCSRRTNPHPRGSLDWRTFHRLRPVIAGAREVHLHGCGESLMHPRFLEMLEVVKIAGPRVNFNSNFTLITPEVADRLIQVGVDSVVASLDGATARTYEGIRQGARFETVRENILHLTLRKQQLQRRLPILGAQFVAMRRNVLELPDLLRLMPELGLEWLHVCHLRVFDEALREESLFRHPDLAREAFAEARRVARDLSIPLTLPGLQPTRSIEECLVTAEPTSEEETPTASEPPGTCREPWRTLNVQWDGTVFPCCYWARRMGNLRNRSMLAIWQGKPYRDLRTRLARGHPPAACRSCVMLERADTPEPG